MGYESYKSEGITFLFKYEKDYPELLHIYARHLTTPEEAIDLFFDENPEWSEKYQRFENYSQTHGLYWCWLDEKKETVLIISCFRI